jgi:Flp pilus assembly protein TadG
MKTTPRSKRKAAGIRAILEGEAGQNLVEFAVVTPVLLLLLVGAVEVGRLAYLGMLVQNAARAGVQYGSQSLATAADNTGMQNAALNDGQNISGLTAAASHYCTCADGSSSSCAAGDCSGSHMLVYVQVNTTGQFQPLIHCPGLPSTYVLNGQVVMRVAQ